MTALHDAARFVRKHEGGWYAGDEERDLNPTMWGVIQTTYDAHRDGMDLPRRSVREITETEWRDIFADYWRRAHCDELPYRTAITVADHAFNAGPEDAIACLQRAMGITDDGIWGDETQGAIDGARLYDFALAQATTWERVEHYRRILKNPKKLPNARSWLGRVLDFRAKHLQER